MTLCVRSYYSGCEPSLRQDKKVEERQSLRVVLDFGRVRDSRTYCEAGLKKAAVTLPKL